VALKAVVTDLSEVDESLHEHYTEKDGSFYLSLDDFGKHPGAVTLKSTLNKVNKDKDTLAAKVSELEGKVEGLPEDFDADEWARLKAGDGGKPDEAMQALKDQHTRAIEALKNKHKTELDAVTGQLNERDGYIDTTERATALRKAIKEVGIDPDFEDAVEAMLSSSIKVNRADDGKRSTFVETDLGEVDVSNYVSDWAKTKGQKFLGKASGPDPKGNNGRTGSRTITRADFEKMTPQQKADVDFSKVSLVD
jgi:outer membrane murein-binding lipoprotein Lpp